MNTLSFISFRLVWFLFIHRVYILFTRYRLRFLNFSCTSPTPIFDWVNTSVVRVWCNNQEKSQARIVLSSSFSPWRTWLQTYMESKRQSKFNFDEYFLVKIKRFNKNNNNNNDDKKNNTRTKTKKTK